MIYDLVIIGAGASGVSCYLEAKHKNPNLNILLIDKNNEILRKYVACGNSKLNFTNENLNIDIYNNGNKFKNVFKDNPLDKILKFYERYNILYFKDNEGRYYPISESGKNVRELLLKHISSDDILVDTSLIDIKKEEDYLLTINMSGNVKNIHSKRVLFSTGSINYPNLGSDGSSFNLINKFNHTFTDIYPSNVYVNIRNINFKNISGYRCRAKVSLYNDNKLIYSEIGEILFKDKALSGIVVFNVSNRLAYLYKNKLIKNPYFMIDFIPYVENPNGDILSYIDKKIVSLLNSNDQFFEAKNFKIDILSLGDFKDAQSACGGINTDEINDNLESKYNKGMYFSGDILDCDSPCGGYSLSFAFLTGILIGDQID